MASRRKTFTITVDQQEGDVELNGPTIKEILIHEIEEASGWSGTVVVDVTEN
jgi:hypothetical protein